MARRVNLPPEKSLAFQIRRAHLAFARLLALRLNRHGVKVGFWHYLRALWIEEGVTQKQLSDITNVTQTTTVALLNDMAKHRLIERDRDTEDRRKVFVRLTDKGRSLQSEMLPYALELNSIAVHGISKDEVSICLSVLTRMAANLENEFKSDRVA